MNNESDQSEVLNNQDEENGALNADEAANLNGEQGHEGESGDQGKPQSKSANRNQRLKRKLNESEAERANLADENRKLNERFTTLESKLDGVINPPMERPSRVNFESEEEYEDQVEKYFSEKRDTQQPTGATEQPTQNSESQQQPTGQQLSPETRQILDNWDDACDGASEKYEDFDDVVFKNKTLPISLAMRDTVIEMGGNKGTEVLYFLAKNEAEAARISKLSPIQQIVETNKLADKFASSTTNAPAPIDIPKGGGDDFSGKDPEKMSPAEYRDYRRSQRA